MNVIYALSQPLTNYAISAELHKKAENNDYSFTTSILLFAKVANAAAIPLSILSCSTILATSFGCQLLSNQFDINVLRYLDPLFNAAYAVYLIYQLTLGVQLAPALALASVALAALNSYDLLPGCLNMSLHTALPIVDLIWSFTARASLFDKIGSIFLDLCLVGTLLPITTSDKDWLPETPPPDTVNNPTTKELASIAGWEVVPEYIYRPMSDANGIHLALAKWRQKVVTEAFDFGDEGLNNEIHLTTRHLFRTFKGEEKFKETEPSPIEVILSKRFLSFNPNNKPTPFDLCKLMHVSDPLSLYTNGRIDKLSNGLSSSQNTLFNGEEAVEGHIMAIMEITGSRKNAKLQLCQLGIIKYVGSHDNSVN